MTDTLVDVPGVGRVSFPQGMSDDDIASAIKTHILPTAQGAAQVKGDSLGVYCVYGTDRHGDLAGRLHWRWLGYVCPHNLNLSQKE